MWTGFSTRKCAALLCNTKDSIAWNSISLMICLDIVVISIKRVARRVSAAKSYVGETGRNLGKEGLQLHGGIGMTNDLPIGHFLKRLTAIERMRGDSALHRANFVSLGGEALASPF